MEQRYTAKKGFKTQSYEIKKDGVYIYISSLFSKEEYKVPYDTIPAAPSTYTEKSKGAFWCMVVFTLFSLITLILLFTGDDVEKGAWLFWGAFAAVSAVWYLLSKRSYIIFNGPHGATLYFKLNNKNEDVVEEFIENIESSKMKYLEMKVKQYLSSLGRDKINGYIIDLRENMIIDDEGYEHLMKKAEEFSTVDIMGFRKA